ncbi:hypothetical protein BU25DRAFT_175783 [Macroventuria anomochaeta]|uniref:Uncharacterized protein n=1 Tax=Macroventuria anomochaeta TaxID=301207 RepID=A0ACB6RRF7_9PLEO|nr:uncharacterized protein BU25DRAFT_175783 [Macroventuria anomochaeta]KAF2623499.1 hypothetical protein BU25DRAFT_175783 [Macroventuria anomochaeta]
MSRSNDRRNDRRFDSALSLALDQQLSLHTSTSMHGPPASQPWSSYNVRQDSFTETESTNETPASSLYENDSTSTAQAFPPKPLDSIPRSSSPPALSSASGVANSSTISCGQCGTDFTGGYRRGNLARHVRHKHGQANARSYTCRAPNCLHDFRRQDARLKHERKAHPELEHAPVEPRQHHEQSSSGALSYPIESDCALGVSSDATDDYEYSHAVISTPQNTSTHGHISTNLVAAWQTFSRLHATLDDENYSLACDVLFTRWEAIAQELKDKASDAYDVYAQVLDDLYSVIAVIDCETPVDHPEEVRDQTEYLRQHRPYQETARHGYVAVSALDTGTTASGSHNDTLKSHSWRPKESISGKSSTGRKGKGRKSPTPRVDCPMYKHWLVYPTRNIPPPCQGCSASSMNHVRNHVKQRHVGERVGMIPFFHHCTRCEGNFVDFTTSNDHRAARACAHTPQLRNNITTPWAQLYLAIYPSATEVPRPCKCCRSCQYLRFQLIINEVTGEEGFLPPAVVIQCRPRSFLDGPSSGNLQGPPQPASMSLPSTEQPIYDAVMHTMLQDATRYLPSGAPAADLNTPRTNEPHPAVPRSGQAAFQNQLFNAQSHLLGVLLDAPRYMSQQQIAAAVHFLQQIVDVVRAFQTASVVPAALTVDTQPSSQNPDNVFSEVALSPQTDRTTTTNVLPVSPSRLCEYGRSPVDGTYDRNAPLPMAHGQNDLAHVFDPPLFDLNFDMSDVDLSGYLNFEDGAA